MVGSGQLGAMAACVVLFVPLGLAGWHLSRHKVLFFSGALFVSLAIAVHLTPYFPSLSHLLYPSPSSPLLSSSSSLSPFYVSCLPFLHHLSWSHQGRQPTWEWAPTPPARACGFARLRPSDAQVLLNGSWVLVAGDSQARLLALALLRLLLDPAALPPVEAALFRRHSDYHLALPGGALVLDFVWAPFESNLTAVLRGLHRRRLQGAAPRYPDVLVLGAGLWHMLRTTDSSHYGESLAAVRRAAASLLSPVDLVPLPHMFWIGLPTLVHSVLNTEEKRERMNRTMWVAYDWEMRESKILRSSGGPFLLLDIGFLSRGCGQLCTADGMHYDGVVYEAALHIMLNALLIESQQRI